MRHEPESPLRYSLHDIDLNALVGQSIELKVTGRKECIHCGRDVNKTFNQGYCYPCFQRLARCDRCIVKPELCHYHSGTCREPEWGEQHCLIEHVVYLANTTGLKVGVTGAHKLFERWGDQGAVSAMVLARVPERGIAGEIEVQLKQSVSDKTNWRKLLTGEIPEVNLKEDREQLSALLDSRYRKYLVAGEEDLAVHQLEYPVRTYLDKAGTHNLDKVESVSGTLEGIRGQYLFIGAKGLNIRKYAGYEIELSI